MLPGRAAARSAKNAAPDAVAMLYDPTRCVGCEQCIRACAEANGTDGDLATAESPQLTTRSLTVLQQYRVDGTDTFRKQQCMHCVDPAWASAPRMAPKSAEPSSANTAPLKVTTMPRKVPSIPSMTSRPMR